MYKITEKPLTESNSQWGQVWLITDNTDLMSWSPCLAGWLRVRGHVYFCFALSPSSLRRGGAHCRLPPWAHAPALVITPAADSSGLKQYLRWRTFAILGSLGYRHHPWTRLWLCLDEWDRGAAKERCWTFWRERGAFLTHPLCPCGPWSPGLLSPGTLYIYIHLVFPSL